MTREGHVRFCEGLRGKFPGLLDVTPRVRMGLLHISSVCLHSSTVLLDLH